MRSHVILSSNSSNATSSSPAAAPAFGADAASGDQGFFGLLLAQAGADVAAEGTSQPAAQMGDVPVPASGATPSAEPAAPIATALLVGQSWQAVGPLSPDLSTAEGAQQAALAASAASASVLNSALQPTLAEAMIQPAGLADEMPIAGEAGSDTDAEEDDFSTESELGVIAAAFLTPIQTPVPVKLSPVGMSAARDLAAGELAPASLAAAKSAGAELLGAEAPSGAASTGTGDGAAAPVLPAQAHPESAISLRKALGSGQAAAIGELTASSPQSEPTLADVPPVAANDDKSNYARPAEREPSERARAWSTADQPAVAAAAAPAHTGSAHLSSNDRTVGETTIAPDAVAAVSDTAQGGAGGLDQFSAGASHDGAAGRPQAPSQAQSAQTDFKSMLAATDAAEPHRAVQIATVHLEKAAASRNTDALTIQLEPLDLGKIEVRLDFGAEGRVQASILADKIDTLDLLQRDSRSLERALQSAGLQTDAGSLNFNLRGDSRSGREFGQRGAKGNAFGANDQDITEIQVVAARPSLGAAGRVDIRI